MSIDLLRAAMDGEPRGWRTGAVRVVVNALLVFMAYEVVTLAIGLTEAVVRAEPVPLSPVQLVLLISAFVLVRWVVVLPALLLVLVGLEYVARRVPHPRILTTVVAFSPMVVWQVTQSSGDTSGQAVVLGMVAVLFAVVARLPSRVVAETNDVEPPQPTAEPVVTPR